MPSSRERAGKLVVGRLKQIVERGGDLYVERVADGAITLPDGVPTQVTVERPRQKGHGDYATNVALQLAKKAGTNPRAFADLVAW